MPWIRPALAILLPAPLLLAPTARAQPLKVGDVEIGGALRFNFWDKSWQRTNNRPIDELEVDTLRAELRYDEGGDWFASAQYRYYFYQDEKKDSSFFHSAYVGYRPDEESEVVAGINKVPFGLMPYAGNSYFSTIAYYVGLEDDYDLGIRYGRDEGPWRVDVGWYPSAEPDGVGQSRDSARYSYDVVASGTSGNSEENQFNARVARSYEFGPVTGEAGLSAQYGKIPNETTGRTGDHWAGAAHLAANYERWSAKLQTTAYEYDLASAPGEDRRRVTMGAYDYPYKVAAAGRIHSLALSYTQPVDAMGVEAVTLYNDYSILTKQAEGFGDTQHNVTGAAIDFEGPVFVYVDYALGQNNAWLGPNFGTALAEGGPDNDWEHRFNINVGVYF
ncbi:porin [Henriciella aquimarina]|uniref:porin n=1 Tax=Henriciella aquimarina TaxID=545261 RepID=UPI000A067EB9|nr:porin [Henriciella aquimarina]